MNVWNAGDCAAFLKVSRKHFLRRIRFLDDFPTQLDWSLAGHPKWSEKAVRDWALRQDYAKAA